MPTEAGLREGSMQAQDFSATGLHLFGSSQSRMQKTVVVLGVKQLVVRAEAPTLRMKE